MAPKSQPPADLPALHVPKKRMTDARLTEITGMIPRLRTRTLVHKDPSALILELFGELDRLRKLEGTGQLGLPLK